jgi:hypothetical protein
MMFLKMQSSCDRLNEQRTLDMDEFSQIPAAKATSLATAVRHSASVNSRARRPRRAAQVNWWVAA